MVLFGAMAVEQVSRAHLLYEARILSLLSVGSPLQIEPKRGKLQRNKNAGASAL